MWTILVYDAQGHELKRLPLREAALAIGRGKDRDLMLDSPAVSRQHAKLEARGHSLIVEDLGSANGTLLNGQRIAGPEALHEGDEVRIGDFVLRLRRDAMADADKTMIRPPPKAAAAPPATDPAALIRVPERPPAPAGEPKPAAADGWSSASELLEKQLNSIRSFRGETRVDGAGKLSAFEQAWDRVIGSMRDLQQQLQGSPRVLQFTISRNNREVTAKIADPSSRRGNAYLILSPEHPEGRYRDQVTVWLREFGEPDANYDDPAEAMRYFVQRIAGRLA